VLALAELSHLLVSQNKTVLGTINSNRRHFEAAQEALRQADQGWLEALLTDRVPLIQWRSAFDTSPERIKAVIQFSG
jgi:threonine dehydrogenase-like Zn-dependent dehydrogenase